MIVILAEADARLHHPGLPPGEVHAVVAVVRSRDVATAVARVETALLARGFCGLAVKQYASVPPWSALLPTSQGRMFRNALFHGIDLTIMVQEGQTLGYGIPIVDKV